MESSSVLRGKQNQSCNHHNQDEGQRHVESNCRGKEKEKGDVVDDDEEDDEVGYNNNVGSMAFAQQLWKRTCNFFKKNSVFRRALYEVTGNLNRNHSYQLQIKMY